jgi:thioredoxin reductase
MSGQADAAVIVIGAGPCGLILAIELGRRGSKQLFWTRKHLQRPFPKQMRPKLEQWSTTDA